MRARDTARRLCMLCMLCVCLWTLDCRGAPTTWSESDVKAAFLHRFAGYVEWPAGAMRAPRFIIAVLGAEAVAASLDQALTTLTVKGRPAEVRRITDIRAARQAHIVYIGRKHATELDELVPQLATRPVLIVTDSEHGLDDGAMLNFRILGQRVRFEVALDTADEAGLAISADLLAVALRVRRSNLRSDELCPPLSPATWQRCGAPLLARLPQSGMSGCSGGPVPCAAAVARIAARRWLPAS
ncbi:MAG: YfiR family protein [Burkholderiales bacterium]|nr:YfiR family protein [Burkholderiales bacterium]